MLRKLRILISAQHALMLAYRAEIYLWVIASVFPFFMMSIWTTAAATSAAAGRGASFSMTPAEYGQYFISVFAVRQFSLVWMIYEFEFHIVEGRLTYLLLRPMNALWNYVAAHLGEQLARVPFFLLVLVLFFFIFPQARWIPTPSAILLGIFATYCAFALRFALQYCFAMGAFWFERAGSIDQLTYVPYLFLSGIVIPLSDFPDKVRQIILLTPFPYAIWFPARILTGKIEFLSPEMLHGFAVMTGWFVILSLLGSALWKRGLLQYSGHGA